MKANEAPEKLYMNWVNYPLEEMQVEYTRTDAFIEKAVEWLRCHPSSHYDDLEEFSNAFRKAMKGE